MPFRPDLDIHLGALAVAQGPHVLWATFFFVVHRFLLWTIFAGCALGVGGCGASPRVA